MSILVISAISNPYIELGGSCGSCLSEAIPVIKYGSGFAVPALSVKSEGGLGPLGGTGWKLGVTRWVKGTFIVCKIDPF